MTRPAGDADQKLIRAALELIPETGLSGLSVRKVAARAKVNLGMFHYHFRTKTAFSRRVLDQLYETFFTRLAEAVEHASGASPRDRLRSAILAAARFAREHRPLILALVRDLLGGNREVLAFARASFPRHLVLIVRLARDAQRSGQIRKMPILKLIPLLFVTAVGPVMAEELIGRILPAGFREIPRHLLGPFVSSDRAIEERLDFLLDSLAPARGRR
jgi:AcrR family transcriptional regulator